MKTQTNIKTIIFTAGLPGSGKSTTILNSRFSNLPVVDCDTFKVTHPSYDPKNITLKLHDWSTRKARELHFELLSKGESFIVDGTGTNVEKYLRWFQEAKELGFKIVILYCKVRTATAIQRNFKRERSVPVSLIIKKAGIINQCMDLLGSIADEYITVQTD